MFIAQDRHFAPIFSLDDPNTALCALGGEYRKHRIIGTETSLIEIDSVIRAQHNNPLPECSSGHIPQLNKSWSRRAEDGRQPPIFAEQRFRGVLLGNR